MVISKDSADDELVNMLLDATEVLSGEKNEVKYKSRDAKIKKTAENERFDLAFGFMQIKVSVVSQTAQLSLSKVNTHKHIKKLQIS